MTLLAIDERSSGADTVLAGIFATMRQSLGQPVAQIARLVGTTPEVIEHLEAGRLRALPPWAETVRIVTAYGDVVGIEVRPILDRICQQLGQHDLPLTRPEPSASARYEVDIPAVASMERRPMPAPAQGAVASRDTAGAGSTGPGTPRTAPSAARAGRRVSRTRRRLRRALIGAGAAALILGPIVLVSQFFPSVLYASADRLPPALGRPVRHVIDHLSAGETWWSGGFRWIKVDDPRSRKADRLPAGG